jgi:small-conductance mechanosensitive channel
MRRFEFVLAIAFIALGVWISTERLMVGVAFALVGVGFAVRALRSPRDT